MKSIEIRLKGNNHGDRTVVDLHSSEAVEFSIGFVACRLAGSCFRIVIVLFPFRLSHAASRPAQRRAMAWVPANDPFVFVGHRSGDVRLGNRNRVCGIVTRRVTAFFPPHERAIVPMGWFRHDDDDDTTQRSSASPWPRRRSSKPTAK